jgi:NAD(P)H-hydrate repair Nnr-like enzyme with NAD(P)H-hydrate dehydratase domain
MKHHGIIGSQSQHFFGGGAIAIIAALEIGTDTTNFAKHLDTAKGLTDGARLSSIMVTFPTSHLSVTHRTGNAFHKIEEFQGTPGAGHDAMTQFSTKALTNFTLHQSIQEIVRKSLHHGPFPWRAPLRPKLRAA